MLGAGFIPDPRHRGARLREDAVKSFRAMSGGAGRYLENGHLQVRSCHRAGKRKGTPGRLSVNGLCPAGRSYVRSPATPGVSPGRTMPSAGDGS